MHYNTTALEDWVTNFYTTQHIFKPNQMEIKQIALNNRIFINLKPRPSYCLINGNFKGIYLDNRVSEERRNEIFYHELCHIIRHTGSQFLMPKEFRELQEWDAKHFTLYAAIPNHMIQFIPFGEPGCIEETAKIFKVTPELSKKRIEQILERIQLESIYSNQSL
jgi:Zn-dependent peptidase ImmA (M78 family)